LDWLAFSFVVLAIGPAIGGLIILIVTHAVGVAILGEFPLVIGYPGSFSYFTGGSIAAVGIALFALAIQFSSRGTKYLAILSGVIAAIIVTIARTIWWGPNGTPAHGLGLIAILATVSATSAMICWWLTKQMHKLS
jgi:hypothetical protein